MRITASWSGSLTHRIEGCGTNFRAPHAGLPSNVVIRTTTSVPSCSKPSRTSLAVGADAPSLTAPARARLLTEVGRGEETGFQVEQGN